MDIHGSRPLEDLVHWNGDLSELTRNTRSARHRGATPMVTFRRDHAVAAVEKVLAGLANPSQLVDWAQAAHFEDQMDVEEEHQDLLTQFLVEISTPELFVPVTREVCRRWLHVLQASTAFGRGSAQDALVRPPARQDHAVARTPLPPR
ncbi:hypothetical protein J2N69_00430 [Streptomyces huasconensis]|nr:hypothetical protein [Streptomyces huasconensis]UFQ13606.1 hypothetical protein J2N69_00430 [Streptomyces huasconensis]